MPTVLIFETISIKMANNNGNNFEKEQALFDRELVLNFFNENLDFGNLNSKKDWFLKSLKDLVQQPNNSNEAQKLFEWMKTQKNLKVIERKISENISILPSKYPFYQS
jgi:hypothetical protein